MAYVHEYEPIDINFREEQNLGIDLICHQLDEVVLNFNVWNGSEEEDMTSADYLVEFRVHKPDGTDYIQGKTGIDKGKGTLKITCSDQLTAASGLCKGELRVYNNVKKQRTSRIFHIKIIPSVIEVDRKISQSTITLLEELKAALDYGYELVEAIRNLEDKVDEMKQLIKDLNAAAATAEQIYNTLTAENQQALDNINKLQEGNNAATTNIKDLEDAVVKGGEMLQKLQDIINTIDNLGTVIIAEQLPNVVDRKQGNLYIKILGDATIPPKPYRTDKGVV